MKINWHSEANKALDLVVGRMMEAHRGAFVWHNPTNTVLMFANDGYPEQLDGLKKKFAPDSILATAIDDDYSFVMLVKGTKDDIGKLTDYLWESFWIAKGLPINEGGAFEDYQRGIAAARIARHFCGTEKPREQVDWRKNIRA